MSQSVRSFQLNSVLHIELNRMDKKNALSQEMYVALSEAFRFASSTPEVKAVLFKGGEGCFCAGNDIADFLNPEVIEPGSPIVEFLLALARFEKPLVAAVSGPAIGIGTTMLLHCDLVYATEKSYFSLPFVDLGVCPEAGSSYLLTRQLGYVRAAELLLLAEPFDAHKALDYGLINAIVEEEGYWTFASRQAEKLASKPAQAMLASKQLLRKNQAEVEQAIENEVAQFGRLLASDEAKSIFDKFLKK